MGNDIGEEYAMKILAKAKVVEENGINQVKDEVMIQSSCGHHPFIGACKYFWQNHRFLFIVSEYMCGGELWELVNKYRVLPEDLARIYIAEMAIALDFLHNAGVIYRDLKLENIVLDSCGHVKLIDFGLAKHLKYGRRTTTICGTLQFMAPEIFEGLYGHAADWWSLGVISYLLLNGEYPNVVQRKMAQLEQPETTRSTAEEESFINLSERPKSKDNSSSRKKLPRSLRPCALRRPMSATPSFGYRGQNRSKRPPPWSRPQSAEGSAGLRRSKLAAKFSDPTLHDPDYCADFGATYTLSSSQLFNSLMGSCSINEGLDSDSTPAPSPQPSLGDTIKAAAQLEPGLTSKPPLPPTPSPQTPMTSDDIINLKFQRWFPDAILESEIISRTSLFVTPDHSDDGGSVLDEAPTTERNEITQTPLPVSNISTFVKKIRTPNGGDESSKKSNVRFDETKNENCVDRIQQIKSPKIVVHEPDLYGCDIVTEDFVSDGKHRCLTPNYIPTQDKSCKVNNEKRLSHCDLTGNCSPCDLNVRSHSVNLYSENEMCKDNERNVKSANSGKLTKETFYSGLNKIENKNINSSNYSLKGETPLSRDDVDSPFGFETSASKYRLTSTPITYDNITSSFNGSCEGKSASGTTTHVFEQEYENNIIDSLSISEKNAKDFKSTDKNGKHEHTLSSPIRLCSEQDQVYHAHLQTYKAMFENQILRNNVKVLNSRDTDQSKNKETDTSTHKQEKHTHFSKFIKPYDSSSKDIDIDGPEQHSKDLKAENQISQVREFISTGNGQDSIPDEDRDSESNSNTGRRNDDDTSSQIYELLSKHRNGEKGRKNVNQKIKKPVKEVCRAASVPPFQSSKPPLSQLKHINPKSSVALHQNTKKKNRRSMSYDASITPDILEKDSGVSSYEDIVTMIKVLEKEDLESPVLKYKTSTAVENLVPEPSSSAKAILNFLDEVEKGTTAIVDSDKSLNLPISADESARSSKEAPISSRLGSLLNTDTAELAQQVMTLTLQMEESAAVSRALEERYKQSVELLKQQKEENDDANKRQQKFIDQLLKEKRQLAVQYETAIKELEAKHETAIKVIEERHKVEMKKAQDKFNAAEKIRRDKWIDAKTKKIKELTVKGLEPELERMAVTHQQEIADLRRAHQRHLEEAEAAWARRTAAMREQEASERQAAILHEREAARHRLEQEMNQVEKSYQEQRRRLLEEVRQEKELLQRQSERVIAEAQADIAKQVDEAKKKLQEKMVEYDKKHQEELAKCRESLETEKTAWMARQKATLEEKEVAMREELKRERDRHIELAIRRLETEAAAREQAIENKLKRLKESYDAEVSDLDSTLKDLRARLKDARADLQKSEDTNAGLRAQLSQTQNEVLPLKQTIEKIRKENNETLQHCDAKVGKLQQELSETKQFFQEQVNKIHNDKEKQLQQVYTRVKEAISKKEEALVLVTKQRDAALEQCARLEKLLETQRSHSLKL
ncbi:uncharacterized protein LOC128988149 isoform X2 [Macrosteles quadrilineatus]|uniref:uncharacterized protein LOC128988149 isoform X2 n=1 Tax=Macrosteles quadrilineatus TaxID=74068 RepID=UPI0023E2DD5C|nr:uncharacterized protein LOC128988149 isoform X2 [Macrosteles quadrilineatus]